ncbi:hypothetical protein GQ57_32480 [Burkholderia sp. MSh2]|uniref:TagK domain-containing protein n=1 Tax=Burkholderia paludis TaxID=1506587 RepID=A0A6J5EZZ2_9BURK|nr:MULTISPECIES: TagK domain-containing protein [Burkholderia]KEZ01937.1 hypothetical protein GQ57_32480 [Burkholderia sp. MSh2]KFG93444.1 hypothetical protein GQ56_0131790 [Burkholderia paludis]CAB3772148.1 hypothetical protein LMG30113_06622 [Burkholderia paludis]VWC42000.1 hypothetical protein BPA30113_06993 [Burkholderia paludis]
MRSLRFRWRRQPAPLHTEPLLGNAHALHTSDQADFDLVASEMGDLPHGDGDVLEQLGIGFRDSTSAHVSPSGHAPHTAPASADALIDTLHAQYWRTLNDPNAAISPEWAPAAEETEAPVARPDSSAPRHTSGSGGESDSIEALLFGDRTLNDEFEQLDGHAEPAFDIVPIPEVLRLFAPPEFQAAAARRGPALPPALTRREHHALTVDSPLSAPSQKDEG